VKTEKSREDITNVDADGVVIDGTGHNRSQVVEGEWSQGISYTVVDG
jgi:hypothetical protein